MATEKKTPEQIIGEQNELIKLPRVLITDDGRRIGITKWSPVTAVDDVTRISIEGVIIKPQPKAPEKCDDKNSES